MDNFEWSSGTAPRFGLAATDFATQERTPRPGRAVLRRGLQGQRPARACRPPSAGRRTRAVPRDAWKTDSATGLSA